VPPRPVRPAWTRPGACPLQSAAGFPEFLAWPRTPAPGRGTARGRLPQAVGPIFRASCRQCGQAGAPEADPRGSPYDGKKACRALPRTVRDHDLRRLRIEQPPSDGLPRVLGGLYRVLSYHPRVLGRPSSVLGGLPHSSDCLLSKREASFSRGQDGLSSGAELLIVCKKTISLRTRT
jgi:hypothetical protein